jgi:small nuclear ribonucleoprotein (snRNP)-like protein
MKKNRERDTGETPNQTFRAKFSVHLPFTTPNTKILHLLSKKKIFISSIKSIIKRKSMKRTAVEKQSAGPSQSRNIPVSLGKPSLRNRLEDYYSLIAPDTIANEIEWKKKFDLIYAKYGGSEKGERALMTKLCKKYGTAVRLMLTVDVSSTLSTQEQPSSRAQHDEDWYTLHPEQQNSGVINFTSDKFDAITALNKTFSEIEEVNGFIKHSKYLDNIYKFRPYLPVCDPLYKPIPSRKTDPNNQTSSGNQEKPSADAMKKKIPVFTSLASCYQTGPLSFLYAAHVHRERIRVLIRYVDCIRGTLTGFVIAFDKHMNLLLRDVDEVFTNRVTTLLERDGDAEQRYHGLRNIDLELERRKYIQDGLGASHDMKRKETSPFAKNVKISRRHFQQLLVRGDNIVSIWKAEEEKTKI